MNFPSLPSQNSRGVRGIVAPENSAVRILVFLSIDAVNEDRFLHYGLGR